MAILALPLTADVEAIVGGGREGPTGDIREMKRPPTEAALVDGSQFLDCESRLDALVSAGVNLLVRYF
jgi:hypothetical protein